MKKIFIVTGLSGAGKSTVMKVLEDMDFYCIDNIPHSLIVNFCSLSNAFIDISHNIAFGVDIRSGDLLKNFPETIEELKKQGIHYNLIFMDASDFVLLKRYKETRRKHPLFNIYTESIEHIFERERHLLTYAKNNADILIDTTSYTAKQLKEYVNNIVEGTKSKSLNIHIYSFGFKYGIPTTADTVFDVRCLPNPYYIENLRKKTGLDNEVREYVFSFNNSIILKNKLNDMFDFLLPLYIKEGKTQFEIAIGCTGGKHRSISMVEEVYEYLKEKEFNIKKFHRDIEKV